MTRAVLPSRVRLTSWDEEVVAGRKGCKYLVPTYAYLKMLYKSILIYYKIYFSICGKNRIKIKVTTIIRALENL